MQEPSLLPYTSMHVAEDSGQNLDLAPLDTPTWVFNRGFCICVRSTTTLYTGNSFCDCSMCWSYWQGFGTIQQYFVSILSIKIDWQCFEMIMFVFDLILYVPVNIFFSYVGMGLPGLNQYLAGINVSCSRTQRSATSEAWTQNPSISSQV